MFHICFAANESYIKYTAVLITSIIKSTDTSKQFKDFFETNTHAQNANRASLASYKKRDYSSLGKDEQSEGFIFHILSDFVSENSRAKLANLAKELSKIYPCEIQIHICDNDIFQGLPKLGENYLTYFRFFIPNFIPENTKLCLYLDVDMLVCRDLRELFSLDLKGKVVGVVKDLPNFKSHILHSKHSHNDDICFYADDFYFNAGVMLINLDEWQRQQIKQKVFDCIRNYKLKWHDQDALNIVIQKEQVVVLPFEYNLLSESYLRVKDTEHFNFNYPRQEVEFALLYPVVLHFSGDYKAWNGVPFMDNEGKNLGLYWWDMAWQTPSFKSELKKQFEKSVDNYLIYKDFGFFVASLINEHTKSFLGYLKMPFVVWRAFKEFDLTKNDDYVAKADTNLDKNLAFELLYIATKAWGQRKQSERICQFIALSYKIYRAKCRCRKGNFRAQRESVYHKLYIT